MEYSKNIYSYIVVEVIKVLRIKDITNGKVVINICMGITKEKILKLVNLFFGNFFSYY